MLPRFPRNACYLPCRFTHKVWLPHLIHFHSKPILPLASPLVSFWTPWCFPQRKQTKMHASPRGTLRGFFHEAHLLRRRSSPWWPLRRPPMRQEGGGLAPVGPGVKIEPLGIGPQVEFSSMLPSKVLCWGYPIFEPQPFGKSWAWTPVQVFMTSR